jgi:hypothetical protein
MVPGTPWPPYHHMTGARMIPTGRGGAVTTVSPWPYAKRQRDQELARKGGASA